MPADSWTAIAGITLTVLGAITLISGLWLMLAPASFRPVSRELSEWHNTDAFATTLNRRIHWERFFYRHHHGFGTFLILGSLYILYRLFGSDGFAPLLHAWTGHPVAEWLLDASRIVALIGTLLALAMGAVVFQRPSLLKGVEKSSNRWIETETPLEAASDKRVDIDTLLLVHPRVAGAIVTLASTYILFMSSPLIYRMH